ncbi:two-component system protein A [Podospora appendiculata]|uniref:histidine kinase n=1 Tax=Podospora appendiculata TaxID=314037 RepID=A0AAE0XL34_9PEZI|nr:two-component system protein A [Podospora appendiculata]
MSPRDPSGTSPDEPLRRPMLRSNRGDLYLRRPSPQDDTPMSQPPDLASEAENGDPLSKAGPRFARDLSPGVRRSNSASPFRLSMPATTPGQLAFSALQFLPAPVLVLDNLKTVVLANEAMGRLLGISLQEADGMVPIMDQLRGQTLSQVGIDLIQGGGPVWVDWEQLLDDVAVEIDNGNLRNDADSSWPAGGDETPTADSSHHEGPDSLRHFPSSNAVIEVVISRRDFSRTTFDARAKSKTAAFHAYAKMIISTWEVDNIQTYFTLTFTHTDSTHTPPAAGRKLASRSNTLDTVTGKPSFSGPPSVASSHDSRSSFGISPSAVSLSSSPFPPLGPPAKSSISSTPSILQKITVMKDALLDNTQTPVLAMWKDGSVTFPNKAARDLFNKNADFDTPLDGFDLLSAWTIWTEDFSRQLDPSEYPISVLIQTETPFTGRRIGMRDSNGKPVVFDVEGAAIKDDNTGEFLAGVVTCRDVTKHREEINQIKAADEERFRLICDTMPQLVWTTTPDGAHDFFNNRWYSYTGLTEEESIGLGWKNPFHPDDMAETEKRWKHCLMTGEPYMTEYRCRSKDGEWRWFLGRALPLRNKQTGKIEKWFGEHITVGCAEAGAFCSLLTGTCTDVHESIEAKLEAKRTRQQLLSVIAHSRMTMFTVDLSRSVTMLEGSLIWDSNLDSGVCVGENVYDVFNRLNSQLPEGQMPHFLKPLESILTGKASKDLQEHEMGGRWYRTRFLPVLGKNDRAGDNKGYGIEGVIGLILDVTELKARERDIEHQAQEKRQLVANEAAAKEASRLKSQFLANMSHEIRTPITGVIGMAELLLDVELGEEQRELTENIYRSGNALLTVINDILDFSKVESGRLDIEEVQFSLSVIVKDVSKMLSFASERKNLDFRSDIALDIESNLVVMGDPGRVRQIITNLLTNSIKFTNQGYVKFSILKEKETPESLEIRFVIEDTGIGIEEEVRKRLFQPFSQGDASTARKFGGTGLGLTICKHLLDLMKGRMVLESKLGVGTTATFWITFNKPQGNQKANLVRIDPLPDRLQSEMSVSCNSSEYEQMLGTPPTELMSSSEARSSWRHPSVSLSTAGIQIEDLPISVRPDLHILVVEDNAINQQIATKTIKKLGFQVTAAWNGKEALEYITACKDGKQKKPDIILMDVQMPVIDGYKCTHLLRHHLPYKSYASDIPIVAMTASAIQGDKEKCKRAGMDDYLSKPVKSKTLERMLVRWITSKRENTVPVHDSAFSDCSEAGEQCENAEIPCIGLDDEVESDDTTPMMPGSEAEPHEDKHNLPTPRPRNSNSTEGNHFPGYTITSPSDMDSKSDPLGQPDMMQPIRSIITDEDAMQSRDDKLMEATGGASSHYLLASPLSMGEALTPENALTEENVGRLEEENSRYQLA